MKYRILGTVAAAALLMSGSANALIIDNFDVTQTTTAAGVGVPVSNFAAGSMIGGERDITITQTSAASTASVVRVNQGVTPVPADVLDISNVDGNSVVSVVYDGVGSGGFGATNFEAGGDDTLRIVGLTADFPIAITIDVTDSLGATSQATDPGFSFLAGPTNLDILFSSFVATSGGGADFGGITQIAFTFTTSATIEDLQIDLIETQNTVPDIVISEPSTLAIIGLGMLGLAGFRRRLSIQK